MELEEQEELKNIIDDEVIVDCYNESEVEMGWEGYLHGSLYFPFEAKAELLKRNGGYSLEDVKVVGFDYLGKQDFFLKITLADSDYIHSIPATKITHLKASAQVKKVFKVWEFWLNEY